MQTRISRRINGFTHCLMDCRYRQRPRQSRKHVICSYFQLDFHGREDIALQRTIRELELISVASYAAIAFTSSTSHALGCTYPG